MIFQKSEKKTSFLETFVRYSKQKCQIHDFSVNAYQPQSNRRFFITKKKVLFVRFLHIFFEQISYSHDWRETYEY